LIVKKDASTIKSYLEDSSNLSGGFADEVIIPETQEEVARIIEDANLRRSPVTISGGGTGTTGGRIPFGGTVVSMERLTEIKDIVSTDYGGYVILEAGALIKDLKQGVSAKDLFYAYDPTEQTAFVGGTVATNASGARSFKYGSTRDSVLGLKAVLASGAVLDIKRGQVRANGGIIRFNAGNHDYTIKLPTYKIPKTKNSAGYYIKENMDLVDLFIGQEGTLACILEVTLKLYKKPDDIISCFVFFETEQDACGFAMQARSLSRSNQGRNPEGVDALALEYFDSNSLTLLREKYGNIPPDIEGCIFFEQEIRGSDEEKVLGAWQELMSAYNVSERHTWVAMNESERYKLLDVRHAIAESMNDMARKNHMPKVTTDLAVPEDCFLEIMDVYKRVLSDCGVKYFLFGHIGTVSAEHGIGKMRREYLSILYGEEGLSQMLKVKETLDPNLILGRGNIFKLS